MESFNVIKNFNWNIKFFLLILNLLSENTSYYQENKIFLNYVKKIPSKL